MCKPIEKWEIKELKKIRRIVHKMNEIHPKINIEKSKQKNSICKIAMIGSR